MDGVSIYHGGDARMKTIVLVGGVDITNLLTDVTVKFHANDVPMATLTLPVEVLLLDGAKPMFDGETAQALRAIGWPPAD